MKMFKNKRGQFYIFIAVILCSFALSLVIKSSNLSQTDSIFLFLRSNYMTEVKEVMDNSLFDGTSILDQVGNFTDYYITYAASRNVDMDVLILLSDGETLHIKNLLDGSITARIGYDEYIVASKDSRSVGLPDDLRITYKTNVNEITLDQKYPDIKVYFDLKKIA